jgi:hypothetical protein
MKRELPDMKKLTLGLALLAAAATSLPLAALAAPAPAAAAAPAQPMTEAQYAQYIGEVRQTVEAWRLAWELGDVKSYTGLYHPSFKGTAGSRQQWEQQRRARMTGRKDISVKIENLEARPVGAAAIEVRFVQHYTAGKKKDTGVKLMTLRREDGAWRITEESWSAGDKS